MTVDEAIELAARDLPSGWQIQINVEAGGYSVKMFDETGSLIEENLSDSIESDIESLVEISKSPICRIRNKYIEPEQTEIAIGDYVFASKYSDCSPSDGWVVGYVKSIGKNYVEVADSDGNRLQRPGFKCAMKITGEQGKRIVDQFPSFEGATISERDKASIFNGCD